MSKNVKLVYIYANEHATRVPIGRKFQEKILFPLREFKSQADILVIIVSCKQITST